MKITIFKALSALLTAAVVCGAMCALPLTVSAKDNGKCGDNLTWTLNNGTLTISGTGEMYNYDNSGNTSPWSWSSRIKSVVIQSGVTSIGDSVLSGCESLTSVTIPNSVTSIGGWAFCDCSLLTSITIPDGVTIIGNGAFYGCSRLAGITLPDSITDIECAAFVDTAYYDDPANWAADVLYINNYLIEAKHSLGGTYSIRAGTKIIADAAFFGCWSLTSVIIPNGVTSIGNDAFCACSLLTGITIPDSVTSIGDDAFWECSLLTSITIPDGVTSIGNCAFYGCKSLTHITVPDGVTYIGDWAFLGCSALTGIQVDENNPDYSSFDGVLYSKNKSHLICCPAGKNEVEISDGVTNICDYAFCGCESLAGIMIPSGVTSIGEAAFCICGSLKSISIPDSVTSIGEAVFYGCSSLESITIPEGVTNIGDYAFDLCKALWEIQVNENNPNYTSFEGVLYSKDKTHLLRCPEGHAGVNILGSVTVIADGAFCACSRLTGIVIPYSVTSIGAGAFESCHGLASITIPNSVRSVGDGAFYYCSALMRVEIRNNCAKIGVSAFERCEKLTVYGYSGSSAENAAKDCLVPFAAVSECPNGAHKYGEWETVVTATCTEKGIKQRKCSLCDRIDESETPALGHDCDTEWTIDIPATATTPGSKSHHCKVCGARTDVTVIEQIFKDVTPGAWYVSAVQYAIDNSLFSGMSNTAFEPNTAMTRAMLVKVLYNLEGNPSSSEYNNPFEDVKEGQWYTDAVKWARANGVVYGTSETAFSPNDKITREQLSAILHRYSLLKGYDVSASADLSIFPDGNDTSGYAKEAMSWAVGAGLISGNKIGSVTKLDAKGAATRAQVALILMRYKKTEK